MNFRISFLPFVFVIFGVFVWAANAQTGSLAKIEKSAALQATVDKAATETIAKFAHKNLKAENLAITVIDLTDQKKAKIAGFRGTEKIYPASVVKLFYLAAAHQWLETGKIKDTPELQRALKDMIVVSSNDATQYIVDVLTDTSSGAELTPEALAEFSRKRNVVNRYFASLNYENINVCQKTYCEDAYGREQQFRGLNGANRNKLTTDATARLLAEITTGNAVTPERSQQMMNLLKRDFSGESKDPDDQAHGFTGIALKPGAKLWSKAGWTSTTRHDAAYIEITNGQKFVLVVFTENFANEREIIPSVARIVLENIGKLND
jgi:beta-lactamase class A